jgi:hypothetical protein
MQVRMHDALTAAGMTGQQIGMLQELRGAAGAETTPPRLDINPGEISFDLCKCKYRRMRHPYILKLSLRTLCRGHHVLG